MRFCALLGVLAVFLARDARAGSFDVNGVFSFDPTAAFTDGFNDVQDQDGGAVTSLHAGDAIEGAAYVNIDTTNGPATFPVTLPAADVSYVARMFARTNRVVATLDITYPDDGGSPSFAPRFYPSGTVTSDGWYEVVTNPFSLQGSRGPDVTLTITASGADVDALEIVPAGTFHAPATCTPPFDSACRSNEFCATGWCRDGDAFVPPLPSGSDRDGVLAYFRARESTFFGGRFSRATYLPNALATLDGLHEVADAWSFWNGIITSIHRLHDWHTTINGPVSVSGRGLLPVCFDEGSGDLSDNIVAKDPRFFDVLVTIAASDAPLTVGDRLVAVNGMHPFDFADSLESIDWGMWRSDDPDGHAEAAERLVPLIRRYADTITVIRCNTSPCSAPQTLRVADLPVDDGSHAYPNCDHRPFYHIAGPDPVAHDSYNGPFFGVVNESQPNENIYGMVWDDVFIDPSGMTANPYQPAYDTFRASANAVILDHRTGNGGDVNGATYLTSLFRTPATLASWAGFGLTVGEFDGYTTTFGLTLYQATLPFGAYMVGDASARTNLPVAILLARDGSASDWFPRGMVGGAPNIRVFGRHTAGAFSSYFDFDYYANLSWRLASGDLINPDGTTNLGTGVQPDEEIVPLQSDLLAGRDTAYARALAWIRSCTTCR